MVGLPAKASDLLLRDGARLQRMADEVLRNTVTLYSSFPQQLYLRDVLARARKMDLVKASPVKTRSRETVKRGRDEGSSEAEWGPHPFQNGLVTLSLALHPEFSAPPAIKMEEHYTSMSRLAGYREEGCLGAGSAGQGHLVPRGGRDGPMGMTRPLNTQTYRPPAHESEERDASRQRVTEQREMEWMGCPGLF